MDNVIPFPNKPEIEKRVVFLDPKDQEWTLMFPVSDSERMSVTAHPNGLTLRFYNVYGTDVSKNEQYLTYAQLRELITSVTYPVTHEPTELR